MTQTLKKKKGDLDGKRVSVLAPDTRLCLPRPPTRATFRVKAAPWLEADAVSCPADLIRVLVAAYTRAFTVFKFSTLVRLAVRPIGATQGRDAAYTRATLVRQILLYVK